MLGGSPLCDTMNALYNRRKPRVEPEPTRRSGTWSDPSDRASLQRTLDELIRGFRKQPMGFLTSEGSTLLCAPPNEVYDRLVNFLSNVSIVSGLVLSAIAGAALNPYRPEDFVKEQKSSYAEAYNAVAAITVSIQLCVVLYSTFTLYILISTAHSPTATYRSLAHMTRFLGFCEFMTFVPAMGSFALIVLACHLHCSRVTTYIVLGVVSAGVLGFQLVFNHMCLYAFPYNSWCWSSVFGGAYWLWPGSERRARAHGELLVAQASEGVLGGLDEDGDYVVDGDDTEPGAAAASAEAELATWVAGVLVLTPTQRGLLARGLHAAGLTRARMVEAAQHTGGFQTLCEMLASSDLRLRPGERLALASAAMSANVVT